MGPSSRLPHVIDDVAPCRIKPRYNRVEGVLCPVSKARGVMMDGFLSLGENADSVVNRTFFPCFEVFFIGSR